MPLVVCTYQEYINYQAGIAAEKTTNMEYRQCKASPSSTDCLRLLDQFATGQGECPAYYIIPRGLSPSRPKASSLHLMPVRGI